MCDNPLRKGLRTDSLLGREECKSPFGSYELKIPKDNNMECTADGFITNTNCKDLDVSSNARYLFVSINRSVVIWNRTLWGRADWDSRRSCWREKLYSNPLPLPSPFRKKSVWDAAVIYHISIVFGELNRSLIVNFMGYNFNWDPLQSLKFNVWMLHFTGNLDLSEYWGNFTVYPSYIKFVLIKQTATFGAVATESWPLGWKWFDPMWLMISFLVTTESDYDPLQVYYMVEHKKNICRLCRFYPWKVDPPRLSRDQRFVLKYHFDYDYDYYFIFCLKKHLFGTPTSS